MRIKILQLFKCALCKQCLDSECAKTTETDEDFNPQSSLDGNAHLDKRVLYLQHLNIFFIMMF